MKTKLAIIALLITAPSLFAFFGSENEEPQESSSAQTMLSRFDVNNSADLDIDELTAAETSRQEIKKTVDPSAESADPAEIADQLLKSYDKDGNAALDLEELKAAVE